MPVLATLEEWIDSSFGFKPIDYKKMWNNMMSVKSSDWAYEKEWRVIIPLDNSPEKYIDQEIYPQEIGEIIFGCRISDQDREDILNLLTLDLEHVTVVQAKKNSRKFTLDFEPLKMQH